MAHVWLARLEKQAGDTAAADRERDAALSDASTYKPALEFDPDPGCAHVRIADIVVDWTDRTGGSAGDEHCRVRHLRPAQISSSGPWWSWRAAELDRRCGRRGRM